MAFSKSAIRVTLSIWIYLMRCSTESTTVQNINIDDTIVSEIMNYVQPYFKTFQVGKETFHPRINYNNIVVQVIDDKIQQLKPYFEDRDGNINAETNNHLELEGPDETTIVEFVSKPKSNFVMNTHNFPLNNESEQDAFQMSIRKYKKIRNRIKLNLEKETISKKTKKMVIQTVDDMIAKLMESKCPWKNNSIQFLRNNSSGSNCYFNGALVGQEECEKLKGKQHLAYNTKSTLGGSFNEILNKFMSNVPRNSFFDMFSKTVTNVLRNSQTIANKYKVRCSVIDMEKKNKKYGYSRRSDCDDFRLCSDEFRVYMLDFYKSLNDTAVSVFRNYAAMYLRDVNADDSDEKHDVITTINNASDTVADEIIKLFIRQTSKITFEGKGKKEANIAAIKEYVRKTIKRGNRRIEKHVDGYLSNLGERIVRSVKKDIIVNLGVDLGNLESHFISKICSMFVTCNGEVSRPFRKQYQSVQDNDKTNRVFVKVQLTLDDELKNTLVNKHNAILRNYESNKGSLQKQYELVNTSSERVAVTRTSIKVDLTTTDHTNAANVTEEYDNKS